jgi:hypothetical protein
VRKARPRAVYDAATGVNVQTSGIAALVAPSLVVAALVSGWGYRLSAHWRQR